MKISHYRSLLVASLFGLTVSGMWIGGSGCRPASEQGSGDGGSGGNSGGNGGSSGGNGGTNNNGGTTTSNGGTNNNGGTTSNGGATSSGGTTTSNGGTASNGGATSNGGSTTSSNGGTTGGSTSSAPTGTSVTIATGKGNGAMVGYGWVSLGSKDSVSDPTCSGTAITSSTSCAATTWSTTDSLCVSGAIPALPASPVEKDYTENWGISVGLNATEPAGKGIGQTFATVSIAATGVPSAGARAQVHRVGDPDGTSYCLAWASGPLQLSKFATDCYMTTPTKLLAASDIPNIDKVMVQVSSGSAEISVSKLCITGITFGN